MKTRNYVILALINSKRKSGIHKKSNKAKRRKEKVKLLLEI